MTTSPQGLYHKSRELALLPLSPALTDMIAPEIAHAEIAGSRAYRAN